MLGGGRGSGMIEVFLGGGMRRKAGEGRPLPNLQLPKQIKPTHQVVSQHNKASVSLSGKDRYTFFT